MAWERTEKALKAITTNKKANNRKDEIERIRQSMRGKCSPKKSRTESTVSLQRPIDYIQRQAKQANKL